MKKALILLLVLYAIAPMPVLASELPKIAIYVMGGREEGYGKALEPYILAALIKSGRYIAVERSEEFTAQLDREMITQRSGAVKDSEIRKLGVQFGAQFVCVAKIAQAFGTYQISGRIINVETAHVLGIGVAESDLQSIGAMERVANEIVLEILNPDLAEQTQKAAASIGLRPLVPGMAQFHKGSNIKGALFIGGEAVFIIGAVVTEALRADNAAKVNSTYNVSKRQVYIDDAENFEIARNALAICAVVLYAGNIIDGFAVKRSPGNRFALVPDSDLNIAPYIDTRTGAGGLMLSLNF